MTASCATSEKKTLLDEVERAGVLGTQLLLAPSLFTRAPKLKRAGAPAEPVERVEPAE